MAFTIKSGWDFTKIKWLDKYMIGHSGFIAGGCFKNIFEDKRVKDIDMFFKDAVDFAAAKTYFEVSEEFSPYYENTKVNTFKHVPSGMVVELVRTVFGTPEDILSNFDFTIVKFAYYKHKYEDEFGEETTSYNCMYHPAFFEHLTLKRLVIDDKIPFPLNTFERMFRYGKYGYFPCRGAKERIVEAIHELPEAEYRALDLSRSMYDGLE